MSERLYFPATLRLWPIGYEVRWAQCRSERLLRWRRILPMPGIESVLVSCVACSVVTIFTELLVTCLDQGMWTALKMTEACFSENLVSTYKTTRCHKQEGPQCSENLRTCLFHTVPSKILVSFFSLTSRFRSQNADDPGWQNVICEEKRIRLFCKVAWVCYYIYMSIIRTVSQACNKNRSCLLCFLVTSAPLYSNTFYQGINLYMLEK
jgi:hypothetical protein